MSDQLLQSLDFFQICKAIQDGRRIRARWSQPQQFPRTPRPVRRSRPGDPQEAEDDAQEDAGQDHQSGRQGRRVRSTHPREEAQALVRRKEEDGQNGPEISPNQIEENRIIIFWAKRFICLIYWSYLFFVDRQKRFHAEIFFINLVCFEITLFWFDAIGRWMRCLRNKILQLLHFFIWLLFRCSR